MTVGAKIRTVDYNSIQSTISSVLGTGSGNFGYGQTVRSSQVTTSDKVTVNEWANLRNDIVSCYLHINNAAPAAAEAVLNTRIRSNATDSPYTQYVTLSDAFLDDATRMASPATGRQIVDSSSFPLQSTTWPGPFGDYWRARLQSVVTVSWSSADNARFFFNSGGEIRFLSRRTGGASSPQNGAWTALLDSAATQAFGGRKPGTGTGSTQSINGGNFYRLDNNFRTWYSITDSAPYGSNNYSIQVRAVNAPNNNNSNGGATVLEFRVQWFDDFNSSTPGSPDRVDGTVELALSTLRATGALSPSGTFTIENPTITVGRIEPVGIPASTTYQVTPRATSVNEGGTVFFDIATTGVPNGTDLFWSIFGGPNVTSADFVQSTGSFTITNDAGEVGVSIASDYITEGTEFFYLEVRVGSTVGNVVGTSRSVFINDTAFTFFFQVTGNNTEGVNLRTFAIAAGWDEVQRLECQIDHQARCIGPGGLISSYNGTDNPVRHRSVCGLDISGAYPNGLILRNNGTIIGRGGSGGAGGIGANSSGSPGGHGGPGLVLVSGTTASFITIINQGRISGGGGGGGGGAGWSASNRGGGGGGGQPLGFGNVDSGANATELLPGAGGNPDDGFSAGGSGRVFAETGFSGSGARFPGSGGGAAGGLGGSSVIGTSLITNFVPGNISGSTVLSAGSP
jgi:hypothetical protein